MRGRKEEMGRNRCFVQMPPLTGKGEERKKHPLGFLPFFPPLVKAQNQ